MHAHENIYLVHKSYDMQDQFEKYQNISIFVILSDKKCKHTIQKTYVGNYFNLVEYVIKFSARPVRIGH